MWKGRHRDLRGTGKWKRGNVFSETKLNHTHHNQQRQQQQQQQEVHTRVLFVLDPPAPHLCSSATTAPSSRRTASLRCNVGRKPYVRSGRASCSSPKADSEFKPSHAVTPAPAARCHASSFSLRTPRWLSSVYCRWLCIAGWSGL